MRIIVTHLTRMQPGYICVAGVDADTGRQVRPVLQGRLRTELLVTQGGFLDMATLVDLGPVEPCGHPPEVEDHRFELRHARALGLVAAEAFWAALTAGAATRLGAIFGPELERVGNGCAVREGGGNASLGALIPAAAPLLRLTDEGKLRLIVMDGALRVSLPVTDLRLFERDHVTPRRALVGAIAARLARPTACVLCVGLTRPWQKPDERAPRHWLQVNNIHLRDRLAWRLE
jgi:hypothetical protein